MKMPEPSDKANLQRGHVQRKANPKTTMASKSKKNTTTPKKTARGAVGKPIAAAPSTKPPRTKQQPMSKEPRRPVEKAPGPSGLAVLADRRNRKTSTPVNGRATPVARNGSPASATPSGREAAKTRIAKTTTAARNAKAAAATLGKAPTQSRSAGNDQRSSF